MRNTVNVTWTQGMSFEASLNDHKITIDAVEAVGGQNKGPRPKALLLVSLGGCTGMDVVSMLKKMRVDYEGLNVEVSGELTDVHPKVYHSITVRYLFKGKDLPMDKIEKAVNLSMENYCGVTAMLKKSAEVKYEIVVEA